MTHSAPRPPVAKRIPHRLEAHGEVRIDDWYWLRDRDNPDVIEHLKAENAWTEQSVSSLEGLRQTIFEEMKSRIEETDLSVPVRRGEWWYYSRTVEGLAYPIHCRLPVDGPGRDQRTPPMAPPGTPPGSPWDDEQVVLDENALAETHPYLAVTNFSPSLSHQLVSYACDVTGDERYTLRIRQVETQEDLPEVIAGTSYGVAWANDSNEGCGGTLFYTKPDGANRPYQLWRHVVGTEVGQDVLVYEEPDERFHLSVHLTKDRSYVVLTLQSQVTSEVHLLDASNPAGPFMVVEPRRQGIEYGVEHLSGTLLIITNDGAKDFRIMAAPATDPGRSAWREVLPERPGVRLEGMDVFARHVVTYERLDAMARICVRQVDSDPARRFVEPLDQGWLVPCPETPSTSRGSVNPMFDSNLYRYEYTSMVTPWSVYDVDLDTGETFLRKRQPVLGGYDPDDYVTERRFATADDGTQVPMSVVRRRDLRSDQAAPCVLYGYGAYEACIDPTFEPFLLSLLDRGVIYAIAHVRGGGELGRSWYEQGKLKAKVNTFSDFVACARALIDAGLTAPDRLCARGESAGGLLMGAVCNLAPETFKAIVAEVPFVDVLTDMLDPTLPLTVIEWEEWGNPDEDPEIYEVIRSYSPYDKVSNGPHPDILATAGLSDPRVGYWEPAKWVQKLRSADANSRILLKTELEAGHGGPTDRYEAWKDEAFILSFILDELGVAQVTPVARR